MEVTIESLASTPWVTLGSFALAFFGILLAIIFYFRSQKNKTPCYEEASNTIIEGLHKSLDGLEIHYKGNIQERITVTKVAFWNDGKETIDKSDTVEKDPLRIELPNSIEVLDIQVIDVSSNSNSVSIKNAIVTKDKTTYTLDFEYLDNNDYFVIQIIHNGSSQEELGIEGKIKGVKRIEKTTGSKIQSSLIKAIPFMSPVGELMSTPIFFKYFGSLTYFSIGLFISWYIFSGKTDWFMWLGAGFCFLATGIMYYGFRHIAPVKI